MSIGNSYELGLARHEVGCAELMAVMEEQEAICRQLLELSRGERVALADGRIDDLEKVTLEKSSLVDRMEHLESKRKALAQLVAGNIGIAGEVSLFDLAAKMESKDADKLLRIRKSFVDTMAALKEHNDSNIVLMRKSLDVVRDSLRKVRRAAGSGDRYNRSGQLSLNIKNNISVDCHA